MSELVYNKYYQLTCPNREESSSHQFRSMLELKRYFKSLRGFDDGFEYSIRYVEYKIDLETGDRTSTSTLITDTINNLNSYYVLEFDYNGYVTNFEVPTLQAVKSLLRQFDPTASPSSTYMVYKYTLRLRNGKYPEWEQETLE